MGRGEITIGGKSSVLQKADGIIIPAHQVYSVKPRGKFKIILMIIK
jgi:mannose-6-phosphate isomerase-like protein (cupin superfamily)